MPSGTLLQQQPEVQNVVQETPAQQPIGTQNVTRETQPTMQQSTRPQTALQGIPQGTLLQQPSGVPRVSSSQLPSQLTPQESFFEGIMRLNQGKLVDVYMNFDGSQLSREVFTGVILAGGERQYHFMEYGDWRKVCITHCIP